MTAGAPAVVGGGDGLRLVTAAAIAEEVGGELVGDGTVQVDGVAALDRAAAHQLGILSHARYVGWFRESRAGVVLMAPVFRELAGPRVTRIVVEDPMAALLSLLPRFHRVAARPIGIHPTAAVADDVVLGADVAIEAFAVIERGVVLGDRVRIGAHSSVGADSTIGNDSWLHPHVTVYPFTELRQRVVLCAGARVGREGFGWVPRDGVVQRVPHAGRCVIGNDVEIGANSTVDRGSVDDTVIGDGTKIDSLVQIAHNVRIGRGCFIASLSGLAGSTRLEDGVQLGGQVGLSGHLTVGAGATVAAQAGVFGDIPAGETWSGYPARPHREQLRALGALHRLSGIMKPLERLLATVRDGTP